MGITSRMLRFDGPSAERVRNHRAPSDRPASSSAGGVFRGSKRLCANRAQWRLVRGQGTQRLSEHYRLACDYGTSILTVYNEGDPVFLCENHVSAITPRDSCIAGVRPVEAKADGAAPDLAEASVEARPVSPVSAAPDMPILPSAEEAPNGGSGTQAKGDENPIEVAEAAPAVVASGDSDSTAGTGEVFVPPAAPAVEEPAQGIQSGVAGQTVSVVESVSANRGAGAARIRRDTAIPIARTSARDLTYGNAAKALVDETIWNMATGDLDAYRGALELGKTEMEAAQAAGGQIAIIHRKIAEYTAKIEPLLSVSKASISIGFAIDKPLEQAILEIIGSPTLSEAEKDVAVAQLGGLQEQIKSGLPREITPLQAHRIALEIGQRSNWGGDSSLREEVKNAHGAVYKRLRDALRAFVPEARDLDERLSNLYAAKADLASAPGAKAVRSAAL